MLLFLLCIFCALADSYPTVEDLIYEDYEMIEALTDVERNGPSLVMESASVKPNEQFRQMFVKIVAFVDFCMRTEKRETLILSAVYGQNRFSNDTQPSFGLWRTMLNYEKYMAFRLYMCALCDSLNFFDKVRAVVAVENKRTGDDSIVLQEFVFDASMKSCKC